MNKIRVLSDELINQIAAGEVVERPASVIKELVENSIDAGATIILVKIEGAGTDLIEVADNGSGMTADDALLALERHATSKISHKDDLSKIHTMGFRGEALPSIASVSRMRLTTSAPQTLGGVRIELAGGKINSVKEVGAPNGTVIEVRNLFFNMPARLKFLKSKNSELSNINQVITKIAIAYPTIHFKLVHHDKTIFDLPPQLNYRERIASLFGSDLARQLLHMDSASGPVTLEGYIGPPSVQRAGRDYQYSFVNHRSIQNKTIFQAASAAYWQMLPNNRYPVWFLYLKVPPDMVDVNVHPAKLEVRFRDQNQIYNLIETGLKSALQSSTLAPCEKLETCVEDDFMRDYKERVKAASGKHQERIQFERQEDFHPEYINPSKARTDLSTFKVNIIPDEGHNLERVMSEDVRPEKGEEAFWQNLAIIGQLHNTYLLCQNHNEFVIVDQHAAHERATYEKLVNNLKQQEKFDSQRLLFPLQIQLSPRQQPLIEEQISVLEKLGFELAVFGENTLIIQAAPAFLESANVKPYIEDILDELVSFGKLPDIEKIRESFLERLACHSSIRANQPLPVEEMRALLNRMSELQSPFTCPHGRPTAIRFPIAELERRFKRT